MSTNYDFAKRFAPDVSKRLNNADDYLYAFHKDPIAAARAGSFAGGPGQW